MGKRGPARTPTPLLKVRGSDLVAEREAREPESDGRAPHMPKRLVGIARDEWNRLIPVLESRGIVDSEMDLEPFARYCELLAEYVDYTSDIRENGISNISEKGYECQRPVVALRNKVFSELRALECQFGLTPASRAGLDVRPKEKPQVKVRSRA